MINIERQKIIDEFLKKTYKEFKEEKIDIEELKDFIYGNLVRIGITENKYIRFGEWINTKESPNYVKNLPNLDAFVDPSWSYFCQFINKFSKQKVLNHTSDPIKLYISLDDNHIYKGVNMIMKYLSDNDISHISKVGKKHRNDNIVLRIEDLEDAKKVIDFINNNPYLVEGHNNVSPFCFKKGIVGMAVDNTESYNETISINIVDYFCECNTKNETPSYEGFVNYMGKVLEENKDSEYLKYYQEIIELIYKALTSEDENVLYEHYNNVHGNRLKKEKPKNNDYQLELDVIELALKTTAKKHSDDFAIQGMTEYLIIGATRGISRFEVSGHLSRELLQKFNHLEIKEYLVKKYNTNDLRTILTNILNNGLNKTKEQGNKEENEITQSIQKLIQITKETYYKYGIEQIDTAISKYLTNGYFYHFTGVDNKKWLESISYKNIKQELSSRYQTEDVYELTEAFIQEFISRKKNTRS